jgi:Sigma-70 region 2
MMNDPLLSLLFLPELCHVSAVSSHLGGAMITAHMKFTPASISDADLVQSSLTGNSGAFSEIVVRYQTLICSLAYNATGSLSRCEDLAQEVFLTAWKELRQLREQSKLRSWLCGIARRLTANTRRREGREPVCEVWPPRSVTCFVVVSFAPAKDGCGGGI